MGHKKEVQKTLNERSPLTLPSPARGEESKLVLPSPETDILIIGGGLVGLALALMFKGRGFKVVLCDQNPKTALSASETRTLALSWSSLKVLKTLLGSAELDSLISSAAPISHIHISEAGTASLLRLHASDYRETAFGYIVPIGPLYELLLAQAEQSGADFWWGRTVSEVNAESGEVCFKDGTALHAQWILACDGGNSKVRELLGVKADRYDYAQTALVTSVGLEKSHQFWAFERFLDGGVLAALPLLEQGRPLRAGIVWVQPTEVTEQFLTYDPAELLSRIQQAFGQRLGRFSALGPRHSYPLQKIVTQESFKGRVLFMGNAAHQLNPVGAQGWNLALRDIAWLGMRVNSLGVDLSPEILTKKVFEPYQQERAADQTQIEQWTHSMAILYGSSDILSVLARRSAMKALRWSATLRESFVMAFMGKKAYRKIEEASDAF
jgi:2-octaprenyl-6-methoxyphenol hydroxylase